MSWLAPQIKGPIVHAKQRPARYHKSVSEPASLKRSAVRSMPTIKSSGIGLKSLSRRYDRRFVGIVTPSIDHGLGDDTAQRENCRRPVRGNRGDGSACRARNRSPARGCGWQASPEIRPSIHARLPRLHAKARSHVVRSRASPAGRASSGRSKAHSRRNRLDAANPRPFACHARRMKRAGSCVRRSSCHCRIRPRHDRP